MQYKDWPDWLSEEAIYTLKDGYLNEGETPKQVYELISRKACEYLNRLDLYDDIFHCLYMGWIGTASAFFSNFGRDKGLPISCNMIHLEDSIEGIYKGISELAALSQNGAGVAVTLSDIRPAGSIISRGGTSVGTLPVSRQIDMVGSYVSQDSRRPGAVAINFSILHKDVPDILRAKDHLQGDHRKHIDCNIGLTVPSIFMEGLKNGNKEYAELWALVLETQLKTGSPYLLFEDNVNNQRSESYIANDLRITASNICQEVVLYTDKDHTFVCCLCSLNLATWEEWKRWKGTSGKSVAEIAVYLLDAGLDDYILKGSKIPGLENAIRSVQKERSIGVGVMGLHYLYQSKQLPFKSYKARQLNKRIFARIQKQTRKASVALGIERGIPLWCVGQRNALLNAVAPTRTNSVISGAFSAGIEPNDSNYYVAKQSKGNFIRRNKHLEVLLESKGKNTEEVWDSILFKNGSVFHLDFLTFDEKLVFATAREIDQQELIRQASERQQFIDQSQSLNRFYHPNIPAHIINEHIFTAHNNNVKTLYYTRTSSPQQLERVKGDCYIVTRDDCKYCKELKELLQKVGIKYVEIDKGSIEHFPWRTVPQVWYEGCYIGGYEDMKTLIYNKQSQVPVSKFVETVQPQNLDKQDDCKACEA
jgi:ribonucleoside-diphosphate reductase alpha chain